MVGGTYYAATGTIPGAVILASLPYALLCTTVLMGKHIDKIPWDAPDGTHTLPVLLGEARARAVTQGDVRRLLRVDRRARDRAGAAGRVVARVRLAAGDGAGTWKAYSEPKPAVSPVPNPVWPLWFARRVVPRDTPRGRPVRARVDRRRHRRLVSAGQPTSDRRRQPSTSDSRTRRVRFGCTILFNRAVARRRPRAERRARDPLRVRGFAVPGRARDHAPTVAAAARRTVRRARARPRSCTRVESTLFYMGLERGTAAAVALIFYAYPRDRARRGRGSAQPACSPARSPPSCSPSSAAPSSRSAGARWRSRPSASSA